MYHVYEWCTNLPKFQHCWIRRSDKGFETWCQQIFLQLEIESWSTENALQGYSPLHFSFTLAFKIDSFYIHKLPHEHIRTLTHHIFHIHTLATSHIQFNIICILPHYTPLMHLLIVSLIYPNTKLYGELYKPKYSTILNKNYN